jgi:hypothetical protein
MCERFQKNEGNMVGIGVVLGLIVVHYGASN